MLKSGNFDKRQRKNDNSSKNAEKMQILTKNHEKTTDFFKEPQKKRISSKGHEKNAYFVQDHGKKRKFLHRITKKKKK